MIKVLLSKVFLSLAFLLLIVCVGSAELSAQTKKVKLVSSLPKTGSANAIATSIANGMRLAFDEVNYKAGNFEIVYEDLDDASPERGAWDPALEASNADKAVADKEVVAFLGPMNSGAAKISMPKTNQAGLLHVTMGPTYPGLTKPGKGEANEPKVYRPSGKINFFRVIPADDLQGVVAAKWAKEMGFNSLYILHDRELYGKGLADVLNKFARQEGLKVAGLEGIDPKASNYRALATKIKALKPDAVFFGGTTQSNAGQLAKDLKSAGVSSKLMLPDGCYQESLIQAAGKESLDGNTFITFGGVPPNMLSDQGQKFYQNYKTKYKLEPESYAAYAYETARVVIYALEHLPSDLSDADLRAALIQEVSKISDFKGALGSWSFDQNGDTTLSMMSGLTIENGQFKFVKLLDYKSN